MTLPSLDVDDAKRVLATAIGQRLDAIADALDGAVQELDALRLSAGFVNGLAQTAATCKRELEVTSRKIREEIADVNRALNERPALSEAVDAEHAEKVRGAR